MHDAGDSGGGQPPPRTILLVEDDGLLRRVLVRLLRDLGYAVLSAGSCGDAQSVFDAHEHPIDILLSDVMLPDGTGPQLAHALSRAHPGLKILLMSAHSRHYLAETNIPIDGAFLQKPFLVGQLDAHLRSLFA